MQGILFKGIWDTQCGFKCFKRDAAHELFRAQTINGFSFDVEILYLAKKRELIIQEMPVEWVNRKDSRVSLIRSPLEMINSLLRIRMNAKKGIYDV